MQFIPLDQTGVFGGPNITPCSGCTATEPAPFTAAVVPVGDTHSVIDADGLNTYSPARCRFIVATLTLELLTVDGASAFGDGYVVLPVPICSYLAHLPVIAPTGCRCRCRWSGSRQPAISLPLEASRRNTPALCIRNPPPPPPGLPCVHASATVVSTAQMAKARMRDFIRQPATDWKLHSNEPDDGRRLLCRLLLRLPRRSKCCNR